MSSQPREVKPEVRAETIGGLSLQYLFYAGDGPPVVLLHATGFNPWLWHPISRELAGSFRVYAPYFCDHRESDPNRGGLGWPVLAEDLFEFCQALELERPLMAGHSMGATIIALANAVHPGLAERVALFEPVFLPEGLYGAIKRVQDHPLARKSIKRRNFWKDHAEAEQYLLSRTMFERWDREMLDLYLTHGMKEGENGGLTLVCSPEKEASLFMGSVHFNPWPVLSRVTSPVLILEGETSENRAFIDLKKATAIFPQGRHHLISGAGHLIPQEKPAETARILQDLFRGP